MQPAETRPGVAALPRRDHIAVLAGVTAVAWAYLVLVAVRMQGMDGMGAAAAMQIRPWSGGEFLLMFLMWAVMMVPTAAPTALVYAAVARKAERQGSPSAGAFRLGLEHDAFCLGCCWILMLLLFAGGVMNLLWIAGITLFVLLEKVIPHGVLAGRAAGLAMIATGAAGLADWLSP